MFTKKEGTVIKNATINSGIFLFVRIKDIKKIMKEKGCCICILLIK